MFDIVCIGHITADKIVSGDSITYLPGGTAYYFSCAISNLGLRYQLVTALGEGEKRYVSQLEALSVNVMALPSKHTVCFENIYAANQDHRRQRVARKADPFQAEQLSNINASLVHLGPLLADDMSSALMIELASHKRLSLDVQGLLREVVDEEVRPVDWADKAKVLPYIHYLKANEEEARLLTGESDIHQCAEILASMGVCEVVITLGSQGSLVYHNGEFYSIPAIPARQIVDATGCGDTYMAGYLARRIAGDTILQAGIFAATLASRKIERSGAVGG